MINYQNTTIAKLVIHHIGKVSEGEDVVFSNDLISLEVELEGLLKKFFLGAFKEPDYHSFSFIEGDFVLNPMYNYVGNVFDDPESFYEHSIKIGRYLYEKSGHPFVKEGDFYMVYLQDILIDDEMVDGVLLFKAENKESFLKVHRNGRQFDLEVDQGINTSKPDKACLILDTDRDIGFKILNIDHSNKQIEARYWKDDFLYLSPMDDAFHSTKEVIRVTAEFVKKRLPADTPIDKKGQGELLKKTEQFFKNNETFELENFKESVFETNQVSAAFDDFLSEKLPDSQKYKDTFSISEYAVKSQAKVFKSVIKLDKNFHIYVHGDHMKIQKGELENGQKYYMLYYDEES